MAATPNVSYSYDASIPFGKGRLASVTNGASSQNTLQYDALGHVVLSNQQIEGQTYPFSYGYNLAGSITSESYPSSRVVSTSYDGANRPSGLTETLAQQHGTYVAGATYAPQGALAAFTYGNGAALGFTYDNGLRPQFIKTTSQDSGAPTFLQFNYAWNGDSTVAAYSENISGPQYSGLYTLFQKFLYDRVGRIMSATELAPSTAVNWSRGFSYDPYGNMWESYSTNPGVPFTGDTPTANNYTTSNQRSDRTYDSAGNQTSVSGNTALYDAENRQATVTEAGVGTESYVYDGNGNRVEKISPAGVKTVYVYDALGQLAAEYSTGANTPPCSTCYLSWDHLGTPRMVTDQTGKVVARHAYLPFGEELTSSTPGRNSQWGSGIDTIEQKFTGQLRDSETGLDYFGARYYGSALSRWTTPDEVNVTPDRMQAPSSALNKYPYGADNPLKFTDPDGEDITLFYTSGGPAGHAMLAYNQQTGDSAAQSFGPANHRTVTELEMAVGIPVPGTADYGFGDIKSADQLRQEYSTITIQTSPEETQKAIQYIRTHSDGKYDTYTNNCTTTCAKILRDLRLYRYAPIIPQALFSTLADQYSTTKFNRPQDTPQHGKDYGNPRPGYDAFQLLFLSIQRQSEPSADPGPLTPKQPLVTSKICYTDDNGTEHCQ